MSIHKYYKITSDGQLIRLNQFCPRCGPGYFMANNYDRLTCGQCGYTEFKPKKKAPKIDKAPEETKPKTAAKKETPAKAKKKKKKR